MSEQSKTYLPFHQKSFWEDFYKNKVNETINWYFDITKIDLPDFSVKDLSKEDEYLILGPGNSSLLDYFNDNDYQNVTAIDFSQTLVNSLAEKYKNREKEWEFTAEDILKLDKKMYEGNFDVVIDKGCIDCMLSAPKNAEENFSNAISFVISSLIDKGCFYYFSYGKPEERINLFYSIPRIKLKMEVIDMNTIMKDEFKEFNSSDNIYYLYIINKY